MLKKLLVIWVVALSPEVRGDDFCEGVDGPKIDLFLPGASVIHAIYGTGQILEVDHGEENVTVIFPSIEREFSIPARKLGLTEGCLEGITVGDRVAHLQFAGNAMAVGVNYYYGVILVKFFFDGSIDTVEPRWIRVLPLRK